MNDVTKKETGFARVGEMLIPCDTTVNTDDTFDTILTGKIGEKMYFLEPEFEYHDLCEPGKMIAIKSKIQEVTVVQICYATGCGVTFNGITSSGEEKGAVQELFFRSYEEASEAADKLNNYYVDNEFSGDWLEDFKTAVGMNYWYMLQFPVKPQEILLVDDKHYLANRVIAYIYEDYAMILYQGHDDETYTEDKKIVTQHEYSGIKNEYKIVRLIPKQNVIIDMEEM